MTRDWAYKLAKEWLDKTYVCQGPKYIESLAVLLRQVRSVQEKSK